MKGLLALDSVCADNRQSDSGLIDALVTIEWSGQKPRWLNKF